MKRLARSVTVLTMSRYSSQPTYEDLLIDERDVDQLISTLNTAIIETSDQSVAA